MATTFEHKPHQHITDRKTQGPNAPKKDHISLNDRFALLLTKGVGTMWCAYLFAILALLVLPDALRGGMLTTIQWLSQTFIQLVMLSVIMVGQNVIGQASEERAQLTYKDAEAAFHEAQQIQLHLKDQDEELNKMLDRLEALEANFKKDK